MGAIRSSLSADSFSLLKSDKYAQLKQQPTRIQSLQAFRHFAESRLLAVTLARMGLAVGFGSDGRSGRERVRIRLKKEKRERGGVETSPINTVRNQNAKSIHFKFAYNFSGCLYESLLLPKISEYLKYWKHN